MLAPLTLKVAKEAFLQANICMPAQSAMYSCGWFYSVFLCYQQQSLLAAVDIGVLWRAAATAKKISASASHVLRAVERPLANSKCTNVLKLCSCAHGCVCAGRSRG